MNHLCTHCGQVQLSSLLVIIICHVSLCVVVFRSVGTSKIRKEMQSVLMPEDVQSWDHLMTLAAVACGFFHKYHKRLPWSLGFVLYGSPWIQNELFVFGQSVSYDSIISGTSPDRLGWHRTRQCHLNSLLNRLQQLQMRARTTRRSLVRKKP